MIFYPPYPKSSLKIPPQKLSQFDNGEWIAQRKFNGTNVVITVFDGKVSYLNRHGESLAYFNPTPELNLFFNSFDRNIIFNCEYLNSKAKSSITNEQKVVKTFLLHDILFLDKTISLTYLDRYFILDSLLGNPKEQEKDKRALFVKKIDEYTIWLSECFIDDFEYRYYEFLDYDEDKKDLFPEIEGLILKRKNGSFLKNLKHKHTVDWMLRVRKPKPKTYSF